ncbi:MAG: hypothetical protein ACR2HD_08270 [Solirubrobacteraceae bacterium]|nr:MAG: hypothetical protein DLM63_05740 [Solirubrobacterales bacterium]
MDLLERPLPTTPDVRRAAPAVELDERAARHSLRQQVSKLEGELCAAFTTASPFLQFDWSVPGRGGVRGVHGPRILGIGELEALRDALAEHLRSARMAMTERAELEGANRRLVESMLLEPGRHKFVRVRSEDLGERACGAWEVRPRLGLVGMLMGWWQVKLSSGCPLATGPRPERRGSTVQLGLTATSSGPAKPQALVSGN